MMSCAEYCRLPVLFWKFPVWLAAQLLSLPFWLLLLVPPGLTSCLPCIQESAPPQAFLRLLQFPFCVCSHSFGVFTLLTAYFFLLLLVSFNFLLVQPGLTVVPVTRFSTVLSSSVNIPRWTRTSTHNRTPKWQLQNQSKKGGSRTTMACASMTATKRCFSYRGINPSSAAVTESTMFPWVSKTTPLQHPCLILFYFRESHVKKTNKLLISCLSNITSYTWFIFSIWSF